jgi:hypothetical protein
MDINEIAKRFNGYPDMALSGALIAAAIVLVVIALSPVNHWFKALALAYVILP